MNLIVLLMTFAIFWLCFARSGSLHVWEPTTLSTRASPIEIDEPTREVFSVYSLGSSWCCEKMADTEAGGPKSHARRDLLIDIASKAQKRWQEEKCFEQDAPLKGTKEYDQPKHFVTFPYPYMNGTLHLGHTFSLTKTEFSMGYERLKGKKTLWPFGECRTQDCGTSPGQHGLSPVTASRPNTSNPSSSP